LTDFHGDEAKFKKKKKKSRKKKSKWPTENLSFSTLPILKMFCKDFRDWSLG